MNNANNTTSPPKEENTRDESWCQELATHTFTPIKECKVSVHILVQRKKKMKVNRRRKRRGGGGGRRKRRRRRERDKLILRVNILQTFRENNHHQACNFGYKNNKKKA